MKTLFKIPVLLLALMLVVSCGDSKKEKEDEEKGLANKLCNCTKEDVNNWNRFANGLRENSLVMDIISTENLKCNEYWEEWESLDDQKFEEIDEALYSCPYSEKWAEINRRRFECPECIAEKY